MYNPLTDDRLLRTTRHHQITIGAGYCPVHDHLRSFYDQIESIQIQRVARCYGQVEYFPVLIQLGCFG